MVSQNVSIVSLVYTRSANFHPVKKSWHNNHVNYYMSELGSFWVWRLTSHKENNCPVWIWLIIFIPYVSLQMESDDLIKLCTLKLFQIEITWPWFSWGTLKISSTIHSKHMQWFQVSQHPSSKFKVRIISLASKNKKYPYRLLDMPMVWSVCLLENISYISSKKSHQCTIWRN